MFRNVSDGNVIAWPCGLIKRHLPPSPVSKFAEDSFFSQRERQINEHTRAIKPSFCLQEVKNSYLEYQL